MNTTRIEMLKIMLKLSDEIERTDVQGWDNFDAIVHYELKPILEQLNQESLKQESLNQESLNQESNPAPESNMVEMDFTIEATPVVSKVHKRGVSPRTKFDRAMKDV